MTDTMAALAALAAALGAFLTGLAALVVGIRNGRKADVAQQLTEQVRADLIQTRDGVYELGPKVDGKLDELLKATQAAARAEGHIEGVADERKAHG
jgi:hypothetical protein